MPKNGVDGFETDITTWERLRDPDALGRAVERVIESIRAVAWVAIASKDWPKMRLLAPKLRDMGDRCHEVARDIEALGAFGDDR